MLLFALILSLLAPASAHAACGVPQARAEYETPTDIRRGQRVGPRVVNEAHENQVVALAGVLVVSGGGVTADYTDGRMLTLSTDATARALAATGGGRVYWQASGTVQTAVLELPPSDPARTGPRAADDRQVQAALRGAAARGRRADGALPRGHERVRVPRRQDAQGGRRDRGLASRDRYVSYVRARLSGSTSTSPKGTRRELGGAGGDRHRR